MSMNYKYLASGTSAEFIRGEGITAHWFFFFSLSASFSLARTVWVVAQLFNWDINLVTDTLTHQKNKTKKTPQHNSTARVWRGAFLCFPAPCWYALSQVLIQRALLKEQPRVLLNNKRAGRGENWTTAADWKLKGCKMSACSNKARGAASGAYYIQLLITLPWLSQGPWLANRSPRDKTHS